MRTHGTSPEMIDKDITELEEVLSKWHNTELRGMITLRDARTNLGMSIEAVSGSTRIPVHRIKMYEEDSSRMKYETMDLFSKLYRVSIDHLYFGRTSSFKKKNHLNLSLAGR